jgi:DNA mismatch repair protein MutS
VFANPNTNVILANSTLKQLNIIDDHSLDSAKAGRCSSVLNFVNRCSTAMGKRRVQELVCNPVFDIEWLQREYAVVEHVLLNHDYLILFVRSRLQHVMDIEKLERCITALKGVLPSNMYKLYESLQNIQQIHVCLQENTEMLAYTGAHNLDEQCVQLEKCLNKYLDMDACKNNIIQMRAGIDAELDAMNEELANSNTIFANIHGFFNMALKCTQDSDAEFVKINTTEKSGSSLQITKVRAKLLKQVLDSESYMGYPCFKSNFSKVTLKQVVYKGTTIDFKDIKLVSATGSCDEIRFKQLDDICATVLQLENAVAKRNAMLYNNFISEVLEKHNLSNIIQFVTKLDVVICKAYLAKEYRLCKPIVIEDQHSRVYAEGQHSRVYAEDQHSRVYAEGLRHLLIEQLQQNETYVTNNVSLNANGILLYGTNAVGKTSLIRALGIATVLAQSGFYVPCSSFTYTPFKSIYTRILGNDNLYKGLSTFAVEMSELRVILKNADQNSLILGDELCSGTETQSALSIFVAGLQTLATKNASFIFATHFHEIVDYDEIKALKSIMLKHMAVHYDPQTDKLVYDRVLKDGPGDNMYGLEVCKSLHMPTDFMDKAFALRNKYFPTTAGTLSMPTSHYNANKIRGMCEKCGTKLSTEVHHVLEQRNADADGFIKGTAIRKNHKANLLALCEACHLLEHK